VRGFLKDLWDDLRGDDPLLFWMSLAVVVLTVAFIVFAVLLICGVFGPNHAGQHCVQKNYIHHAKTGYRWDCTKWEKNS